jgi:multisubunit Na+/H+ antiporter MnhG subunit
MGYLQVHSVLAIIMMFLYVYTLERDMNVSDIIILLFIMVTAPAFILCGIGLLLTGYKEGE